MAHPIEHARNSAKKFGGKLEDYLAIHRWFDESKALFPDFRTARCAITPKGFSSPKVSLVLPSATMTEPRFQSAILGNNM